MRQEARERVGGDDVLEALSVLRESEWQGGILRELRHGGEVGEGSVAVGVGVEGGVAEG